MTDVEQCPAYHHSTGLRCQFPLNHGIPDDGYTRTNPMRYHLAERPSETDGYKDCFIWSDSDVPADPPTAECPTCGTTVVFPTVLV